MSERSAAFDAVTAELRVIGRRMKQVIAERATAIHPQLQSASYYLLVHLVENGPTRGSELACQFGIDKGAISRQIQHLVDLGLAERTPDPEDGRAQLVSASEEAVRLIDETVAKQRRVWREQLADWSDAELASLAAQLGRFNTDMG
ncbi:MAG: MarR family winged helix-turn-helix transcriptional regulator [Nocardioides sp.]